jgi:hypothetical protein
MSIDNGCKKMQIEYVNIVEIVMNSCNIFLLVKNQNVKIKENMK